MVPSSTERKEALVYAPPQTLVATHTHYCPGCTHGTAHRLVAEVIDEMALGERSILVASVGCSVLAYQYFQIDACVAAHGRAPAMATGIKRVNPDAVVFTYQGDGDLASIGIAEVIHAAARGEKITVIFLNNAIYGMTGGQMAPTSLVGQVTTSSPSGRAPETSGYPLQIAELLAGLPGTAYSGRRSLHDAKHIRQARQAIRMAFQAQLEELGFGIVELLSSCPTNWGMTPAAALNWIRDEMIPVYPLGDFKVVEALTTRARPGRRGE